MGSSLKFPGDDKSPLIDGDVLQSRTAKETPVRAMGLDRGFDEFVEFADSAQAAQGLDSHGQVFRDLLGIVLGIESEFSVAVVGNLEVASIELLLDFITIDRLTSLFGDQPPGCHNKSQQTRQNHSRAHDENPFLASGRYAGRPGPEAQYNGISMKSESTSNDS